MAGFTKKVAAALISTAIAVTIAWLVFGTRSRSSAVVVLNDDSEAARSLLVERQHPSSMTSAGLGRELGDATLVREPIPPEDARRLFKMSDVFTYDPFTYYRFKGGMKRHLEFAEHEGGFFDQDTSEEGFIESFQRLPAKRDLFVVVAGDSHTEGLCSTQETFPNRLEAALAQRRPGQAIEVLNCGLTGYSFYNYLGVLEKMLPEKPQAFVVAFYGGNDFLEVIKPWHYFHHTSPPTRRTDYLDKLNQGALVSSSAVANAFNQLLFFQFYPEQMELALAGAEQACAQIQRLCTEHGIALFFVYIPPAFDHDGVQKPMIEKAKQAIGLTDADLQQYDRLADKLISVLNARGLDVIDMREKFEGDLESYYWSDLHINVKGHQRIADLLLPKVEAACPTQR